MPREHTLYSRRVVCVSISNRNTMDSRVCVCVCGARWVYSMRRVFIEFNFSDLSFSSQMKINVNSTVCWIIIIKWTCLRTTTIQTATRQCQHVVEYTMHMLHSSRLNANYGVWCATMWFPTESDALILSLSDFSTIFNIFNSWPICGRAANENQDHIGIGLGLGRSIHSLQSPNMTSVFICCSTKSMRWSSSDDASRIFWQNFVFAFATCVLASHSCNNLAKSCAHFICCMLPLWWRAE